jgi:alpha-tubulin suppressor-like RCC1 family protein
LTDTHNVVVGGNNSSLQLGLDNRHISVDNPIMLKRELFDDQNVLKIVCGARFTYFLTEDNVYCCGDNSNLQLFHEDVQPKTIRKLNPKTYNDEQIVDVACSNSCTFLLSAQGHVFCTESWLDLIKRYTKLSIKASTSVPKENTRFDPVMIDPEFFNNQKIAQVSAGYDHVVFLTKSGECYSFCTSYHNQGQDGGPSSTTKQLTQPQELFDTKLRTITRVICSKNNTAFITADECIYVCGGNQSGTLAQGHEGDVRVPSLVRNSFLLINSTGKAFNVSFGMEHMVIFFTDKNTPIGQVLRKMHSKRIYSDIAIHFGQE